MGWSVDATSNLPQICLDGRIERAFVQAAILLNNQEAADVQPHITRNLAHRFNISGRGDWLAMEEPQPVSIESLPVVQALAV